MLPPDRVRACRESLEKIADLRRYTTPLAMDDVDDVRAALGYPAINVYGISYGSLAALQYLRQHPARVRSLSLSGVATPAQKLPLHFAAGAQLALDRLLADCAADAACQRAFPDLAGDLAATLARFDAGPVSFELPAAAGDVAERVSMPRAQFVERLRLMLYNVRAARRVPLVLNRAARGDWAPFARATFPTLSGAGSALALGMYLSVTCSESIPTITEDDIARETRGTFVDADRTRLHVRACREWPRGDIPAAFYAPVASRVPVLMLSGEVDAATPAHFATEVARTLPNARQVRIKNVAHDYFADCLRDLVADFFARGSARELDTRCVDTLRRPPFVLP
jgi:pimeloyl-ACP methyl ester carboxylesterase